MSQAHRARQDSEPGRQPRWGPGRLLAWRPLAWLVTVGIFAALLRRVPYPKLLAALGAADPGRFLAFMVPNAVLFFCWDTLVLTVVVGWFHAPVRYRDLLPVRAACYVVALFNTHLARGTLAAYLSQRLGAPFLELGGTVLFLLLTEYLHLTAWATVGLLLVQGRVPGPLLWIPPAVAVLWLVVLLYTRLDVTPTRALGWLLAPREWSLLRTFRAAHPGRYLQTVLLRAPMLLASVVFHALAAPAFGIEIPFPVLLAFLPVIFMLAALPITVAHLGATQAAWIVLFGAYAPEERLLAFSLAAHLAFTCTRALLGLAFLPRAYADLVRGPAGEVDGVVGASRATIVRGEALRRGRTGDAQDRAGTGAGG